MPYLSIAQQTAVARHEERERCIAAIRRVQKRNTATVEAHDAGKPHTWNSAVKTMADECADAIATLDHG